MKAKKWIVWSDGEVEHTIREDCANARTICTMAMPLGPEEAERNRLHANSIVKAHNAYESDQKKIKDLLAACERAESVIDMFTVFIDEDRQLQSLLKQLRAAIGKGN